MNAFTKVNITMEKIPKLMDAMNRWYRSPGGGNKTKNTPNSDIWNSSDDYDRHSWQYYNDTLSCNYTSNVALASTDSKTVGDTKWTGTTGVRHGDDVLAARFTLDQNYPNPFNPSTVISYQVPSNGMTTLKVFNVVGQEVATLVNKTMSAGSYTATFDASRLSSGVYFYTLRSGNFTDTKKMVLMK